MKATTQKATRRVIGKAAEAKAPVNEAVLSTVNNGSTPAPVENVPARDEAKDDARFLSHISTATFVSAITNAAVSYKYALELELASGLALFAETKSTDKNSKRMLMQVYQQAGYNVEGEEYKTVNRRVNTCASLYDWLTTEDENTVTKWIGANVEMAAIMAILNELQKYKFKGINSVMALVGKPVVLKRDREKAASQAAPATTGQQEASSAPVTVQAHERAAPSKVDEKKPSEADRGVMAVIAQHAQSAVEAIRNRRKEDAEGATVIEATGVYAVVQPEASKDALMSVAMQLLQMAETLSIAEENEKAAVMH